jgi:hypothetical protein
MSAIRQRDFRLGVQLLGMAMLCLVLRAAEAPVSESDLFATNALPHLRIQLDAAAVESLRTEPRDFVAATVSQNGAVYSQVAIHLKGSTGSFRPIDDKPAMTLDFSRFHDGQKFHGLRRIHLNNSVEDPAYVNEKLGSEFFAAAGLPAPRVTRALVELNGGRPRLYVLIEGFTEDFLRRHFSAISGDLYEPGTGHDIDAELDRNSVAAPHDHGRAALKHLLAATHVADPGQRWQQLQATLDTRRFLLFMAGEVILGHRDGYCINRNNYRVYHDLYSGKIVFFPHGMDQLFGSADLPWQPIWSGLVAQAVMSTTEGQEGYAATFNLLLTNNYNVVALTNRVDSLVQELLPILNHEEFAEIQSAAAVVKERLEKRKASLVAQVRRPPLKLLEFSADGAHPKDWVIAERPTDGIMDQTAEDGLTALHIAARAESLASWRTTVLLPPGRYRFEDRVRVAGVKTLPSGQISGARLRVGGKSGATGALVGDSGWQKLSADFEISESTAKIELICELRARAGEAWFDLAAMRVLRVNEKS